MKAKDVMTPDPATRGEGETAHDAAETMARQDTGVVPVTDAQGRCVGVVTDRDLVMQVLLPKEDPTQVRLARIMSTDPLSCGPEEELQQVIEAMKRRQVKRVLVTEGERCIGVISETDIARKADPETVGELVGAVYG